MAAQKPQVFIGSSGESLDIAEAVQANLHRDADCTIWTQGVFKLSNSNLNSLMQALDSADFGIFVLAPDDTTESRKRVHKTPRDNVVFELGLFAGRIGFERTFMIIPQGDSDLHLPTDLLGIIAAEYDPKRFEDNPKAALGPACTEIKGIIRDKGVSGQKNAPPEHLASLKHMEGIDYARIFVGSWSEIHIQGIQKLAARDKTKIIEVLSGYRIGEIRRALGNFRNKKGAKFRACFANMWDVSLAEAYRRKFYDRDVEYMQGAVEDSIKKILGECQIRIETSNNIQVTIGASKPIASYEIRLTSQRITYSYYRIDETVFIVPLDMRKSQEPPPLVWVIDKSILPRVFDYYTNEFSKMFEESMRIYSSRTSKS